MSERRVTLIYPSRRTMPWSQVKGWAADIHTDHERDARGGVLSDDECERVWRRYYEEATVEQAMALLEDEGVATFTRAK